MPADLPAGERKPKYHGVYYKGSKRKFEARFRDGAGNNKTIAYFTNQEEAAHAHDRPRGALALTRRGRDVGWSAETSRGRDAAATRMVRGDES